MDIHMPVMDGLEASSEIKRLGCQSPIVALTANVLTRDTSVYRRCGIAGCLGKPFSSRELWDCLAGYFPPGPAHPPAVDYQAGLNMTGGDRELYEKLRRLFCDQNRNFLKNILPLLEKGTGGRGTGEQKDDTIAAAYRMVHGLKSSAALIGAEELRAAAAEAEATLKDGDYNREQLKSLQRALEAVLGELEGEGGSAA